MATEIKQCKIPGCEGNSANVGHFICWTSDHDPCYTLRIQVFIWTYKFNVNISRLFCLQFCVQTTGDGEGNKPNKRGNTKKQN